MPDFKYDWFTGNIPGLTKVLERFKGKEHVRALEIGPFEGRSTVWFLENILTHGSSTIQCIDHFEGGKDHEHFGVDISGAEARFAENTRSFYGQVRLLKRPSWKALRMLTCMENFEYFDFVYIDGSHLAQDVMEDAVLAWRMMKPTGSIIIFDDYLWKNMPEPLDNPGPGIDAFLSIYKGKYKELMRGYQIAIEKL